MELYIIDTGFFKLDGGAMFGVVPKTIWQRLNMPDAKNLCTWAMRCLLIVQEDRRILIDTGLGNKQSEKFFSYVSPHGEASLLSSLAKHGFSPADITDVILTHLHFDHVGGAVSRNENGDLVPTFPNAIYWSNEAHWQTALKPNAREKASFLKENFVPLQEQDKLRFAKDGEEIMKGVCVQFVHGHTHAMMLPHIEYKGKTLVYLADLIPSTAHIKLPYVMAYDMQPLLTLEEKKTYLEAAAQNGHILFFEHDPQIACATVKQTAKGVAFDKVFDL
ncbi:MAG: MBL fold metallo-hydrolase [Chitinophagales bacterium]